MNILNVVFISCFFDLEELSNGHKVVDTHFMKVKGWYKAETALGSYEQVPRKWSEHLYFLH